MIIGIFVPAGQAKNQGKEVEPGAGRVPAPYTGLGVYQISPDAVRLVRPAEDNQVRPDVLRVIRRNSDFDVLFNDQSLFHRPQEAYGLISPGIELRPKEPDAVEIQMQPGAQGNEFVVVNALNRRDPPLARFQLEVLSEQDEADLLKTEIRHDKRVVEANFEGKMDVSPADSPWSEESRLGQVKLSELGG